MKAPVDVGDIIDGRYRIEKVLGGGAMSLVTLAFHQELEQFVAIKFLHTFGPQEDERLQRFQREARAAAKIQSEHVARVFDFGTLSDNGPYLVMEYLRGNDLSEELTERDRLPIMEVTGYLLQALEALAEAHALGIVHRDIKPENLFLAERPDGTRAIKVLDFGISKAALEGALSGFSLTRTTSFMGSPLYMSPEQMRSSADVDSRSDIWALGTILYEAVSGFVPFSGETMPELCRSVIEDEQKPLTELIEDCPSEFSDIVQRCLQKNREDRFASVADLAHALAPFAPTSISSADRTGRILTYSGSTSRDSTLAAALSEFRPVARARSVVVESEAPVSTTPTSESAVQHTRWRQPLGVAAVAAIALGGLMWWQSSTSTQAPGDLQSEGTRQAPGTLQAAHGDYTPTAAKQPLEAEPASLAKPTPESAAASVTLADVEPNATVVHHPRAPGPPRHAPPRKAVSPRATAPTKPSARGSAASADERLPRNDGSSTESVNAWDPDSFGGRY